MTLLNNPHALISKLGLTRPVMLATRRNYERLIGDDGMRLIPDRRQNGRSLQIDLVASDYEQHRMGARNDDCLQPGDRMTLSRRSREVSTDVSQTDAE
jgi:hypothetical protein